MSPPKKVITRKNHYVPVWYQNGFIRGTGHTLQYLDLGSRMAEPSSGRRKIKRRSPRLCFRERDLYTTQFSHMLNDEIERFLFGTIDTRGADAIRAFARGDQKAIHKHFQNFFEYLDAQKLRTPKGLDWIRSKYANLTQLDLMREMQHLRQMHCTMWFECVREIVSAEKSDVKFIVTDHPVTSYNSACAPTSPFCQYPQDPSIDLTGTQTVFALDADHCLILTNLEYAQDPSGVDLTSPRQNARYAGQTIARTDAMIRTRCLTAAEVVLVNSLLKKRSRRYIAGQEESWLFPEKSETVSWDDIGEILLPPRDMLWKFGGEIFVGNEDGSTYFQDAFGRTDISHKFLKKEVPDATPAPNDMCNCGSGRIYEKCCKGLVIEERPPWDIYSIRERNLMFCNAVKDILGLNEEKTWEDVRRELNDEQVKRVHEIVEMMWPKDTNIADLLPRPDKRILRAVYMGLIDPRTISMSVIGSLAYFDEIVIPNPFPNPAYIKPEYSPTKSPAQHKAQMLKNVCVLLLLEPFIDSGIIHLVPDPMEFNPDFRHTMMTMIETRAANWQPKVEDMHLAGALARDEIERQRLRLPEDLLRRQVCESHPDIDPETLELTIEYAKEKLVADPFALLQPLPVREDAGEVQTFRGINLEFALFIAHLTGSAVYADELAWWRQLHEHTSAATDVGQHSQWLSLIEKLASVIFTIECSPRATWEMRKAGKLDQMRRAFRKVWDATGKGGEIANVNEVTEQLVGSLEKASIEAEREWDECSTAGDPPARLRQRIELSVPRGGFSMNSVYRTLITSGRAKYAEFVPMALFLKCENAQ